MATRTHPLDSRPFAIWDGSVFIPWRADRDGEPVFRGRRILIDYNDPNSPRRIYYFGRKCCWYIGGIDVGFKRLER